MPPTYTYIGSTEAPDTGAKWYHRAALARAMRPNAKPSTLAKLSTHRSVAIRCAVARHAKTPSSTLGRMRDDDSRNVAWLVARNSNTCGYWAHAFTASLVVSGA